MSERLTDHEIEFLRDMAAAACNEPGRHSWDELEHPADWKLHVNANPRRILAMATELQERRASDDNRSAGTGE